MKLSRYIILFILLVTTIIIGAEYSKPLDKTYYSKEGVLDLSKTDFIEKQVIQLNGQWEFYWNQLLSPRDIINKKLESTYIKVPGNWKNISSNSKYSQKGYGTYRLVVTNIPKATYFGVMKNQIRNSCNIYVDGELIIKDGIPASTMKEYVAGNIPQTSFFEIHKNRVEIIVHVSNYKHLVSGSRPYYGFK